MISSISRKQPKRLKKQPFYSRSVLKNVIALCLKKKVERILIIALREWEIKAEVKVGIQMGYLPWIYKSSTKTLHALISHNIHHWGSLRNKKHPQELKALLTTLNKSMITLLKTTILLILDLSPSISIPDRVQRFQTEKAQWSMRRVGIRLSFKSIRPLNSAQSLNQDSSRGIWNQNIPT